MIMSIDELIKKLEKNGIDPINLSIEISYRKNLLGWIGRMEPGDLGTEFYVSIKYMEDYESEYEIEIGNARCYQIDSFNRTTGEFEDIIEIADSTSGDVLTAITPLVDNDGMLKGEYVGESIFYVDRLYIEKEFRNQGLGSVVLKYLIDELCKFTNIITIICIG